METTGQRIKRLRTAKGLTQEELAKRVGYSSRAFVCNIENDKRDISFNDIEKWAAALGVAPQEMLGYDSPEASGTYAAHLLADPKVMRVVSSYLIMTPEQQAVIDSLCVQFTGED